MSAGVASRAAVKLPLAALLLVTGALGPLSASAAPLCDLDAVLRNLLGAKFLHQRNPNLHRSAAVAQTRMILQKLGVKNPLNAEMRIAAWIAALEHPHPGTQALSNELQRLKEHFRRQHVVYPGDFPESYFHTQQRIARERGQGDLVLDPETRSRLMQAAITSQQESLDAWVEYLASPDTIYPMWAKVWALDGMTRIRKIDPRTGKVLRRGKDTVEPFVDLNREALSFAVQEMSAHLDAQARAAHLPKAERQAYAPPHPELKSLLANGDFANLYGWYVHRLASTQADLDVTDGKWVKYLKGSDPAPLLDSLFCKNTGWCTAGRAWATDQLQQGDFYVYYSNDSAGLPRNPRLAIRMKDDRIAEVRGIGSGQEIDPQIAKTKILSEKLDEFGAEAKRYEKSSQDMKRLTEIENKVSKGQAELDPAELRFLYEIDSPIQGFGYQKDPRIALLLQGRDKREDLRRIFGVRPDEISFSRSEALSGMCKVHFGDLDLNNLRSTEGIQLPQVVLGNLHLDGLTSAKGLDLPKIIKGELSLDGLTSTQGLTLPETLHGGLYLNSLPSAEGLKLPQTIQGDLRLNGLTSIQGLHLPETVQGSLWLERLSSAKGLKLPQTLLGDLGLSNLRSAEGLQFPRRVLGNLWLNRLTSAEGLQLPQKIGGYLELRDLESARELKLPENFEVAHIYLSRLKSAEGLRLPMRLKSKVRLPRGMKPEWIP